MHKTMVIAAFGIASLVVNAPSAAATQTRIARIAAGPACQLSIPTTDTQARPKATGFRNEGTKSEFVICQLDASNGDFTFADIYLGSLDGTRVRSIAPQ